MTGPEPIRYRIRPSDPHGHLFDVELALAAPARDGQRFALPAWIPGSYLIREFARNIVSIEAFAGRRRVAIDKLDKHTWRAAPVRGALVVRYRVYAWDLSVRGAHLDASHGFFNGTSVFLRVLGQEHAACSVLIEPPPDAFDGWRVATTLARDGAPPMGFGAYRAADHDELIDHPVELGRFTLVRFEAGGVPHEVAITGRHDADTERLARDLAAICVAQVRLFEPLSRTAPFERYLFLTTVVGDGYGGLEHRSSTALLCARNDLPHARMAGLPDGYRTFLGLASHEYFHAWHVKRIKPAAFVPYDLDRENPTRLLWIFEGFTSYYDDLMLCRAGVIGAGDYLKALGTTASSVLRGPGRLVQSVAESSFDAWIKYYRQDENTPNAVVSYYAKGALVALCLDLAVRTRTAGRRGLDDVMRLMWRRYGQRFERERVGVAEDAFPALVAEATGVALDDEIAQWAYGTAELPLAALLKQVGIAFEARPAEPAGGSLGVRTAARGAEVAIATAYVGGAAHRAGLSSGDVIVAADGFKVDDKALKTLLGRRRPGDAVRIHAFRRDELVECTVVLEAPAPTEVTLSVAPKVSTAVQRLRSGWLGGRASHARAR